MGCAELMRGPIRPAKSDRDIELPARHREHVRRVVHHLIERDERKTEGHEFDDRTQSTIAAPTPMPAKPFSLIGVSMIRFGPKRSSKPWLTL